MDMKVPFLDLKIQYQSIKHEIDAAIQQIMNDATFIGGPLVQSFEKSFADYCGAKYCIGVGNGTDALYIALRALNIGQGDEVITAANSFIATSEAISQAGARVIFVDCDPKTYCLDVQQIESKITPRTRAIIPIHLYGHPADMPSIMALANKYQLHVIEDAAQAHGSAISGKKVGTYGAIGCFSFYPGKNLGAYGDGGALITNDAELNKKIRMFANHGRITKYDHEFEGVNSRLDSLQAAVLNIKLKYLDAWLNKKRQAAQYYNKLLDATNIVLPVEHYHHTYHLYVVRIKNRQEIVAKLAEDGISTGVHYPIGLPFLKAYQHLGHEPKDFPVTASFQSEILSLPMFPEITTQQIEYVCERMNHHIKKTAEYKKVG